MRVFKFLAHLKRSEGSGTATELIVVRRMYPLLLQLAAYQFAYLDVLMHHQSISWIFPFCDCSQN